MHASAARIAVLFSATVASAFLSLRARGQDGEETRDGPPVVSGYPLDAIPRIVPERGRLDCDRSQLVYYRGTSLRFLMPARMNVAFIPYVRKFEELVGDVATEVYGRPPRSLAHAGSFNCRRVRHAETTLSEHALGNALDVRGFDFGGAPRGSTLPEGVPGRYIHSFRVRVEDHWASEDARYAVHVRFFARLRERLVADPDLFTVMLGPSYPGHRNHLHFDRAPWRYVQF